MYRAEQQASGGGHARIRRVLVVFCGLGCLAGWTGGLAGEARAQMPSSCRAGDRAHRQVERRDSRTNAWFRSGAQRATGGLFHIEDRPPPHEVETFFDPVDDIRIRPTDLGADGVFDPALHHPPDTTGVQIGTWAPFEPWLNIFIGNFVPPGEGGAEFFRLDLALQGLFNPPGPLAFMVEYSDPFLYGDHPVFGFIELDVGDNLDTGGELDFPEYRYLGNIARFGGLPALRPDFALRAARSRDDLLVGFGPVHRSGEEFHIPLFGGAIWQIDHLDGNGDEIFDPGETWLLTGEFLHRAHGYEPYSLASGGPDFGVYTPVSWMLFSHRIDLDRTTISIVFPLTNQGAADMIEPDTEEEPLNGDPSDQASVLEALDDLYISALYFNDFPTGDPEQAIIDLWMQQDPYAYLDPMLWKMNVSLSTTYLDYEPQESPFIWTDMMPNARRGDFDADGLVDDRDYDELMAYVLATDGTPNDCDGIDDLSVGICEFALNFSIYDLGYDGTVSEQDFNAVTKPGDLDLDGDVDLADFITFAGCFGQTMPSGSCSASELWRSDLNQDGEINLIDFVSFANNFGS